MITITTRGRGVGFDKSSKVVRKFFAQLAHFLPPATEVPTVVIIYYIYKIYSKKRWAWAQKGRLMPKPMQTISTNNDK